MKIIASIFQTISIILYKLRLNRIQSVVKIYKTLYSRFIRDSLVEIKLSDINMIVNRRDLGFMSAVMFQKNYEKLETELIRHTLQNAWHCADIGAHFGYYSLLMSKLVGNRGKVYSFEPEKNNFKILEMNKRLNRCENIVCENLAVSNENGYGTLYIEKNYFGRHSMSKKMLYQMNDVQNIRMVTLDTYFHRKRLDFLKIDIEGAEGMLIDGATEVLKREHLKFVLEFWPKAQIGMKRDPVVFLNVLDRNQYRVKVIDALNNEIKSIQYDKILEFCSHYRNAEKPIDLFLYR